MSNANKARRNSDEIPR